MAPLLAGPVAPPEAQPSSPNYFGLKVDPADGHSSSTLIQNRRAKWNSPSSNVRSTAVMSPQVISLDRNPELESFRKQSEAKEFHIGWLPPDFGVVKSPVTPADGRSPGDGQGIKQTDPQPSTPSARQTIKENAAQHPRSPKRLLSSDSSTLPRRSSPASFLEKDQMDQRDAQSSLGAVRNTARPSLPPHSPKAPVPSHQRAETLPASLESEVRSEGPCLVTPQHVAMLLDVADEEILLLDTRVSTQYARSKIMGALNLCIPTTLLKRPSFNIEKLAETFKDPTHRERFERWRSCKYIIAYDGNSAQLKDSATCVNTLRKFANEGWQGGMYIIKGGFEAFSRHFPSYIVQNSPTSSPTSSNALASESSRPAVAPVIGGCPMPASKSAANPFFGNIRQNMDLIGGVGQMPVKLPASLTSQAEAELPTWLRRAADAKDNGKMVSEKFFQIEKREQKRMQDALSGSVTYGTPNPGAAKSVQVAGIEKGAKNRYNNIWPYEHTRVKLEDVSGNGCDYINANYVKAAWSNRRYIATQGPIPDTFADFWNVIWQQDVRVVVMLTAEKENGQIKAHNYWDNTRYGQLMLKFLSEHRASLEPAKINKRERPANPTRRSTTPAMSKETKDESSATQETPYITVRKFSLSHCDHPFERVREITQLQYSSWPDFGAPAHPAHLLGLVEQCDAVVRSTRAIKHARSDDPNQRPVLVHCSAGCGRTGTFCTVDSVIDMLKQQQQKARKARQGTPMDIDSHGEDAPIISQAARPDDSDSGWPVRDDIDLIEKTVEEFRLQRLSMVQSLRQYVLCYESVLEWLAEQLPKTA